jgi:hypothetical protein
MLSWDMGEVISALSWLDGAWSSRYLLAGQPTLDG